MPGVGISLLLIAAGAVLAYAVDVAVSGVELYTVGIILMVVGVIGLLMSLLFFASFAPFARHHDEDITIGPRY